MEIGEHVFTDDEGSTDPIRGSRAKSARRRVALPLLIAAAVLTTTGLFGAAPSPADLLTPRGSTPAPADGPPAPADDPAPVQSTDPSQESYVDPIDKAVPIDAIISKSQQAFGDRYGGAWVDRSGDKPELRIAVQDATSSDADLLNKLSEDNSQVEIASVPYSWGRLLSIKNTITDLLVKDQVSPFDVGPDVINQRVIVKAQTLPSDVRDQIAQATGSNAPIEYDISPSFKGLTPTNGCRSCYPPYEAGLGYLVIHVNLTQDANCTTGLAMHNPDSGQHYGTTAGHCGKEGNIEGIGGTTLNPLGQDVWTGNSTANADVARIQVSDGDITDKIYTQPGGSREVTAKYDNSSTVPNIRMCFQGATSGGGTCADTNNVGDHSDSYFSDVYNKNITIQHLWCIGAPAYNGDSGGPVYHVKDDGSAKAAGLVTAANHQGNMCFSGVQGMENEMNANVMVGP